MRADTSSFPFPYDRRCLTGGLSLVFSRRALPFSSDTLIRLRAWKYPYFLQDNKREARPR